MCVCVFAEGGAVGLSAGDRQKTLAELQSVFKATGFPYHIVPLEQVRVHVLITHIHSQGALLLPSHQNDPNIQLYLKVLTLTWTQPSSSYFQLTTSFTHFLFFICVIVFEFKMISELQCL